MVMCSRIVKMLARLQAMSNRTLVTRIAAALNEVRAGEISPKAGAESLALNGRGLEGMPYDLLKSLESLTMDLEIAQWHEEEGGFPDVERVVEEAEVWLARVPLDRRPKSKQGFTFPKRPRQDSNL